MWWRAGSFRDLHPLFARRLIAHGEAEAWRVFSILLCIFGSVALMGVGVSMAFARSSWPGRRRDWRPGGAGRCRAHDPHHPPGPSLLFCRRPADGRPVRQEHFLLPAWRR